MATAYPPSERYYENMRALKELAGPGFGGGKRPEQDPEDDFSWKKFFHQISCWLRYQITGDKCKHDEKGPHGTR